MSRLIDQHRRALKWDEMEARRKREEREVLLLCLAAVAALLSAWVWLG